MDQLINNWINLSDSTSQSHKKITLTSGETSVQAQLNDTKAAQEFKALLPVTLSMTRMGEHEYYSSLSTNLSEEDKTQTGYKIGNLAYWTPGDLFAIYFDEPDKAPEGLIILGNITDDIDKIRELGNPAEITISLAE